MIDRVSQGYAMSLRTLVVWSTLFALFSEAASFKAGVDIKAFYFVMLFNSVVFLSLGQFVINKPLILFYTYLAFSGLISIATGTNILQAFSEQLIGITFASLYFYNFFRFENFDFRRLFLRYARLAYYVCWIGILLLPFQLRLHLSREFRAQSVLTEPAQFMMIVMPAIYYFLEATVFHGNHRFESIIGLLSIVVADSAVGYMGLMLILICLIVRSRHKLLLLAVPLILILAISGLRVLSQNFRLRFDDTVNAVSELTVAHANTSTFALISNAFVAVQVLQESPILGNGLGSHEMSREKYLPDIPGLSGVSEENQALNKKEAASMFLRSASDLGFLGVCLIAIFLWKFRLSTPDESGTMNTAVLIYLILKLIRAGHYFPPEFFFFVFIYIFSYLHARARHQKPASGLVWQPSYPGGPA
jgi:hypothetical protein